MIVRVHPPQHTDPFTQQPKEPPKIDYADCNTLRRVENNIRRERKFIKLYNQYDHFSKLYIDSDHTEQKYFRDFAWYHQFFSDPLKYFLISDSKLYFVCHFGVPSFTPGYPELRLYKMPEGSDNEIENAFLQSLYQLVKFHNCIEASVKKEFEYFCHRKDELALYNRLLPICATFDENVYIKCGESCTLPRESLAFINLETKNHLNPTLVSFLKQYTTEKYSTVRPDNVYYLYLSRRGSDNHILLHYAGKTDSQLFSALPLTQESLSGLFQNTRSKYAHFYPFANFHSCIMLSPHKPTCTDFIARLLFRLCDGSYDTLNSLAKLFASIVTPEQTSRRPFVILCSQGTRTALLSCLNTIFQSANDTYWLYDEALPYPARKDLYSTKCIMTLLAVARTARAIVITDCAPRRERADSATPKDLLRDLLKGRTIKHNDKTLGTISYTNTLPIVFFPGSEDERKSLLPLKPVTIDLHHLSEDDLRLDKITSNWDAVSYDWMNISFTIYGLLLLSDSKCRLLTPDAAPKTDHVDADSILKNFVDCCCNIVAGSEQFTYADDIYNAYSTFVQQKYSMAPCKRKHMCAQLQGLFNLTYGRPHVSRNVPNKYAIIGISLKENWEESITAANDGTSQPDDYDTWYTTLAKIDSIVPDELYSDSLFSR